MLICKDGCGSENPDIATQCQHCGRSLRSALRLHNPGTRVRHYQIKRVIGWGGFGAVYEAEDARQLGSRVALKESFDPSGMTSFQGEFAVLQQHQHPHLPRYEAMFIEQGNGYLVMEFIPGQSLEDVQKAEGGPLPEKQVLGFALQLCEVLEYLHRQCPPIIHRDLKPANVRLTPSGRIKLVDFGLFKQGTDTTKSSRMGLTPAYAPVEQHPLAPGHTDERSDVYSLGATLYHLLTGQMPVSSFIRIKTPTADPLPPPARLNPRLSPHVAAAISKAMSLMPADRYPSIAAFRQALMGQAAPLISPQQPAKRPAAPLAIFAGVGVGLVALLAVLALVFGGGGGQAAAQPTSVAVAVPSVAVAPTTALVVLTRAPGAVPSVAVAPTSVAGAPTVPSAPPTVTLEPLPSTTLAPSAPPTITPELIDGVGLVAWGGNLRTEPRVTQASVIGLLWPGDQVMFIERRRVGEQVWYRIRVTLAGPGRSSVGVAAGTEGWSAASLLTAPGNTIPTLTPVPPTPRPVPPTARPVPHVPAPSTGQPLVPEMLPVPAGSFLMGSTDQQVTDVLRQHARWVWVKAEQPQHTLTLPAYEIGKTEVTNGQFRPFVEDNGYTNRDYWDAAGWQWRTEQKQTQPSCWGSTNFNGNQQPVVCVTLYEALAYARWLSTKTGLNFSLPTEPEWEYAARGTDGRIYPWGNTWEANRANSSEAGLGKTTPVGQYPSGASPFGALDMAGNVWEWTRSVYTPYPYNPTDGRENLSGLAQKRFTLHGGSWNSESLNSRTTDRYEDIPARAALNVGFRLVRHP